MHCPVNSFSNSWLTVNVDYERHVDLVKLSHHVKYRRRRKIISIERHRLDIRIMDTRTRIHGDQMHHSAAKAAIKQSRGRYQSYVRSDSLLNKVVN